MSARLGHARRLLLCGATVAILWMDVASAQGVDEPADGDLEPPFQPRIAVSETYTSNVELAGDGFEQHEWITEVTPGISLNRRGSRLRYSVDYDLQALFYAEDSDRDDTYHILWAEGQGELISQRAYLDLDARYGQRTLDPADREAASNLYDTNNRTDVRSVRVSPWVRQPLGDFAEANLRYTFADTDYRNTDSTDSSFVEVEDNDARRIDAFLQSPGEEGWTWRADYLYNEVNFDEAETYKYQRTGAELGIPVASRSHVLLAAGVESDPIEDRGDDSMEESWWNLGFRMSPTSRQSFEFRAGDRYFGESYELHWRRVGSRLDLAVDYTEEPSTSALLEFSDGTVSQDGIYGFDRVDTDTFVRKYLVGALTWSLPRSEWRFRFYRDARDYDGRQDEEGLERDDEDILGGTADWRWRFLSRTWLETGLRWETQNLNEGDSDQGWFRVALIRDLTRTLELRIEGRRLLRNSEAIDDYRDNSGLIGLRWLLGSTSGGLTDRSFVW